MSDCQNATKKRRNSPEEIMTLSSSQHHDIQSQSGNIQRRKSFCGQQISIYGPLPSNPRFVTIVSPERMVLMLRLDHDETAPVPPKKLRPLVNPDESLNTMSILVPESFSNLELRKKRDVSFSQISQAPFPSMWAFPPVSNLRGNKKARSDDTKVKAYCTDFAKKEMKEDREETEDQEDFDEVSEVSSEERHLWFPSRTSILRRFRCIYECAEHFKNIGSFSALSRECES